MKFLQVLRMLFLMMLGFGAIFSLQAGDKGEYTRLYAYALLGIGSVGSLVMLAAGLGKPTLGGGTPVACSECGKPLPLIRKPANRREMLWGGWTCKGCGAQLDRSGKKIADPSA